MEFFRVEKGGVECVAGLEGIFIKKLKKTRAGLRMSKKSCNFARNFAERRVTDRKTTINKE
jgi:hypothetical protein